METRAHANAFTEAWNINGGDVVFIPIDEDTSIEGEVVFRGHGGWERGSVQLIVRDADGKEHHVWCKSTTNVDYYDPEMDEEL